MMAIKIEQIWETKTTLDGNDLQRAREKEKQGGRKTLLRFIGVHYILFIALPFW